MGSTPGQLKSNPAIPMLPDANPKEVTLALSCWIDPLPLQLHSSHLCNVMVRNTLNPKPLDKLDTRQVNAMVGGQGGGGQELVSTPWLPHLPQI